jgi:cell volume regulation protein A
MHVAANILVVGFLVFVAHAFTGLFSRTRIPDVLLLTIIGIIIGPVLHLARPESFGLVGPVFATVTLIILLFEAGLTLDLDVLRGAIRTTLTLTLTNFVVTMVSIGIFTNLLTGLSHQLTFLLGAIIGSTSPAVIVPLTRKLRMRESSKTVLFLESAISDVLSIVISIGLVDSYRIGKVRVVQMAGQIVATIIMAGLAGAACAFLWSVLLRRIRALENSIFTTPVVELLGFSGYVAAVVFGAVLGNIEAFHGMLWMHRYLPEEAITLNETERVFIAEVTFLLKTFFFVYLGVSIKFADLRLVYIGLGLTAIIFLSRPLITWISVDRRTPTGDASLIAIMSPKGLAAVVLASVAVEQNLQGGEMLRDLIYVVVFASIVFTCVLSFLIERTWLSKVYALPFHNFGRTNAVTPTEP